MSNSNTSGESGGIIQRKLRKYPIKKKLLSTIVPACVCIAVLSFAIALIFIEVISSDSDKTNSELGGSVKNSANSLLSEQTLTYMNNIAQDQAIACGMLLKSADGDETALFEDALKEFNGVNRYYSFIINSAGEFIVLSEEDPWYNSEQIGKEFAKLFDFEKKEGKGKGQFDQKYDEFEDPVTKDKIRLYLGLSNIEGTDYALVTCIKSEDALTALGGFNSDIDTKIKSASDSVSSTSVSLIILALILITVTSTVIVIVLVKGLQALISGPAYALVFDVKKSLDELEGLDLELTKDTKDEIAIVNDAFFKVVEDLKDHMDDVLKLSGLTEKFENSANFDMLTGIYNRRRFLELVSKHAVLAAKKNEPTFVIMLDLDHFKRVNDTYGHAAGDAVLKTISQRVKETVRPYDLFGRYGGEEFIMFISVADSSNAIGFADRIRSIIEAAPVEFEDLTIPVTTSMGVAQAAPDVSFEDAQKFSDEALYKAKMNGRNRVEFYVEGDASVLESKN